MSQKKNVGLSEKVQDIKRMQNNWMKQRSAAAEEITPVVETKQKTKRGNVTSNTRVNTDKDTLSWIVGGGQKKKSAAPISIRSRSASPARNSSSKQEKARQTPRSRPASGKVTSRSNPTSSRSHRDSRPPNGISGKVTHDNKNVTSEKIVNRKQSYQLDRSLSETDLRQAFDKVKTDTTQGTGEGSNYGKPSLHNGRSEDRSTDLLNQNNFDNLADQLSQKVRKTILEEQKTALLKLGINQDSILLNETDQGLPEAHCCNKCKQFMIPPDHAPVLLVPCGHTFCEPCAEARIKCPACRTKVLSTAVNESLQEIILRTAGKAKGETLSGSRSTKAEGATQSNVSEKSRSYNPSDYSDDSSNKWENGGGRIGDQNEMVFRQDGDFRSTFTPLTRGTDISEQLERYKEEFESLSIRCEAYEHEEEDTLIRVKKKTEEIDKQKKQICNIEREQQRIKDEITSLQEKLSVLHSHQEEFQSQCNALEEVKENEFRQLKSIRDTKKGIEKQRDKIKFLARNVGLTLD
ncbi:uncharacterized protein [Apostichopus japonicus]|uniref:uncharacterized protein n=1 Tax=Stichopus japonicus TaxID=307972 RepID=UPI003AB26C09